MPYILHMPTLITVVLGGNPASLPNDMDGIDQWEALALNLPSQRDSVLINIDEKLNYGAIVKDDWKLIVGELVVFIVLQYNTAPSPTPLVVSATATIAVFIIKIAVIL